MPVMFCFELLGGEQISLFAFAAGIADHAGRAADQCDRLVPGFLKPAQHQQRQ